MIALPIGKVIFGGAAWRPNFLLRDDFTTTAGAPLSSPRTAEPGPGSWTTVTDGNSKMSIANGKLHLASGGVTTGNPGMWSASLVRRAGLAAVGKLNFSAEGMEVGFDDAATGFLRDSIRFGTSVGLGVRASNGGQISTGNWALNTDYQFAVVLRATGVFGFIKGGAFTNWTLLWVDNAETVTPLLPGISEVTTTDVGDLDTFRVLDLPSPFNSDYGLATQRLSGARSANDTFVHEANCVIEFTDTTRPSASNLDFRFRRQDATNYWQVTIDSTGAFTLNEVVAGTPTQRATAAAVVSSGHRVVIIADSTTIRGYSNNVLRWTFASASNFATSTAGELTALGTSGVVNDVIAWPRTLSNPAAGYLDLAVA